MDDPNLSPPLAPPTAPGMEDSSRQRPSRRRLPDGLRLIIGGVTFLVVAEVFTYALLLANAQFSWNLDHPIFGPQSAPINWIAIINLVMLVALWLLLQRLGLLPRGGLRPPDGASRWRDRQ